MPKKNILDQIVSFATSAVKWDSSRKGGRSNASETYDTRWETYDASMAFTKSQLNMMYKKLKCVRLGVNRVADDVASLPYKIIRKQSNGKEVELTSIEPEWAWIENPNAYMNGYQLRKILWIYKGIHGEMVLEIPDGVDNMFKTVYPIPPHLLYVISKGSMAIDHYELDDEYGSKGVKRTKDQVKRFYEPDPVDYTLAHAPLNSCRMELKTLFQAQGFNINYFTNQASPSINVSTEDDLDDDEFLRWGNSMISMLKGVRNAGKILVTDKGAKASIIGNTPVEAGYLDTINKAEEGILKQLGVNPALIDSKNVNRSNVTEYLKSYYEELQSQTNQFDAMMTSVINKDRVFYRTDYSKVPSLMKDATKLTNNLSRQFQDGAITVDEYRKRIGMPADPLRGHMYYDEIQSIITELEEKEAEDAK